MIAIIGWIIFGLVAGLIAKAIMPGKDPGGVIITILLGIAHGSRQSGSANGRSVLKQSGPPVSRFPGESTTR